jgi:hypothetical protein
MRKIILVLVILFAALAGILVVAVMNVNGLLEENREQLIEIASDAAARKVEFERTEVAFAGGLAVRVVNLRVAEDPRFGTADFLSLDDAFVGIRILPALQRRIEVSGIRLDAPTIRVVQTADGFNFDSLGVAPDAAASAGSASEPTTESDSASEGEAAAPLAVAIAALEIVNGTIYFEDRSSADGLSLVLEDFSSSGTDLALDGPIALDFSAHVRSAKPGDAELVTELSGEVAIESLETTKGTVRLASPALYPAIFGVRLEEGDVVERLDDFSVEVDLPAEPAITGYAVGVRSSAGRLSGLDLERVAIDVVYRDAPAGSEVKLDQVLIGLADGTIELEGDLVLGDPGESPFDLTTRIRDLDSGALAVALLDLPAGVLSGRVGGDARFTGDSLEWESLKRSLVGGLRLEIGEGALENVNVLDRLVDGLVIDPGIGALAGASIRDVIPNALSGKRTDFDGAKAALEIADGAVQAKDLSLAAKDFSIQAAGSLGFDGALAADGTIRFSESVSKKIRVKAKELGPLLGEGEIVSLPLKLSGTMDAPTIAPDLSAMTANASAEAKEELAERATQEITDALFGKKREGEEGDPEADEQRSEAEKMIKKGLGRFLDR